MRRFDPPAKTTSPRRRPRGRAFLLVAALASLVGGGLLGGGLAAAPAAALDVTPIEPSTLVVTTTACASYGGDGLLEYVVRDPNPSYRDFVTVTDASDAVVHTAIYLDDTEFEAAVPLRPGEYTITYRVEHETGTALIDVQEFTIGACPDVGVVTTPLECSAVRSGVTLVTFTGLIPGETYAFDVSGPDFVVGGPFEAESDTMERELIGMPPGNYVVMVQWSPPPGEEAEPSAFDWLAFAVEPCQPSIEIAVEQCAAAGGSASAVATLTGLVDGVEYGVGVVDAVAPDGEPVVGLRPVTGDETGRASVDLGPLPGGRDLVAIVQGVWEAEPWVEPPFTGGGSFVPLESVVLAASAHFSTAACPAAPVTPKPAALATSGSDAVGPLLAGLGLLALGAAALGARRAPARR